ncbi:MAG: hypothetical protein JWO38_6143 [Gemmataceae bacterium]|nr:hypothetical protein [Gemmataceae bacterium]
MSTALKCPNPSCPYLFDPSRVPAGEVLSCPRCGMRFTLGPPVPPAAVYPPTGSAAPGYTTPPQPSSPGSNGAGTAASGYPGSPTSSPFGYGQPGYPAPPQPGYTPPTQPTADPTFANLSATEPEPDASGRPTRRRLPPAHGGSGLLQTVVLVIMTLSLIAGVGVMVYFRLAGKKTRGTDPAAEMRDQNLSFEPPGSPWTQDDDTRAKLGSPIVLVYKRSDPEAYMAFGAKDYSTRSPRPGELREGLVLPLGRVFEDIRPQPDLANAKWLGQPALAFQFLARWKDGPTVIGKCYAASYKGIGYWAIYWAGENDASGQEPAFDTTLGKFKLLDLRDKWTGKEAEIRSFGGHRLGYQVLDAEGIWSEPDLKTSPPSDIDPKADLRLLGKEKKRGGRDVSEEATLVAVILDDGGGDPLAEATTYIRTYWADKIKDQTDGKMTAELKNRVDELEGDVSNTVDPTAPIARLEMTVPGDKNQRRLIVISAIKMDGKLIVVHSWCAWGERTALEAKLAQIASSLREAK